MTNKSCLIVFCLFMFFTGISAQSTYNKFVVDGVSWVIGEYYCTQYGGPCDAGDMTGAQIYGNTYYYKLEGDSLIDSVRYAKLFVSFCQNSCMGCGPPSGPPFYAGCEPYQLVALLTEDTINRKVFSRNFNSRYCWNHYDSLFIDFSLAVGDSENLVYNMDWLGMCDTNEFIIDSISNAGFQNHPVKTWYIKNAVNVDQGWGTMPDIQLYEGIGYSFGFSLLYDPGDGTSYARGLMQYCLPGDSSCKSPYKPIGITEIPAPDMDMHVMPNPASGLLTIRSADALIFKVEILDINGRTMMSYGSNELDISSLAPAVYFLQIHTNLGVVYKRVVKI